MIKPSEFRNSQSGFGKNDAVDAMAYSLCVKELIQAEKDVDNLLDWKRLENNGLCRFSDEDLMCLNSHGIRAYNKRINDLPFPVRITRQGYQLTTEIQRVHRSSLWTGRKSQPALYSYCPACDHIGMYNYVPAFCPVCKSPHPNEWPPTIFKQVIDLLNTLPFLKI